MEVHAPTMSLTSGEVPPFRGEQAARRVHVYTLRLPPALAARIREEAAQQSAAAGRSVSINQLLTRWVREMLQREQQRRPFSQPAPAS